MSVRGIVSVFPAGARYVLLHQKKSRPALGSTHLPSQVVPGALSPVVKRKGRDADHSPPSSAEVKNEWICNFTPSYAFMACTGTCFYLFRQVRVARAIKYL